MKPGTLSVIIPNYNHAALIPQALTAVLEQSCRPSEVIVIDDGSNDNSVEVIESFARRDPIVRLVCNERNLGIMKSVARGVEVSAGEFLFFHAADDYVLPGFFEKSLSLLEKHPAAGLSFAFHSTVDGLTGEVSANANDLSQEACYFSPQQLAAKLRNGIPGHTALIRRTAFTEAGGYLSELRWHCDWFNSLVVAFRHGVCFIPECLSLIRVMPTSYSAEGARDAAVQLEVLANLLRHLISPTYRDVLALFQCSRIMQGIGINLAHAALQAGLQHEPDVTALIATLRSEHLVALEHSADPEIHQFGVRAIARAMQGAKGGLEESLTALYCMNHETSMRVEDLESQLRELQSFAAAVRRSAPFEFRRRVAATVRRLTSLVTRPNEPHFTSRQHQN